MASISGNVTVAGDPDDWIACAFDANTHAFAGVAAASSGTYEITGLTAGKAYVVACRPKSGPVWASGRATSANDYTLPTDPVTTPYLYKASALSPLDANFADVVLLMHMDGSNDGATFTDVTGKTVTRVGAVTKTGVKQFGTASAYFDGTDDYLTLADNDALDFGTGDFTVECWVYANKSSQTNSFPRLLAKGNFGTTGGWNLVYIKSTGEIYFDIYTPTAVGFLVGTLTDDVWTHVAACRSGSTVYTWLNGSAGASSSNSTNLTNASALAIGAEPAATGDFLGYIDDVRLTKGVARYTSTFTAPSAAFPDNGNAYTGGSEPTWPTTPGNTVVDGGVTWTNMGHLVRPLMHGPLVAA